MSVNTTYEHARSAKKKITRCILYKASHPNCIYARKYFPAVLTHLIRRLQNNTQNAYVIHMMQRQGYLQTLEN